MYFKYFDCGEGELVTVVHSTVVIAFGPKTLGPITLSPSLLINCLPAPPSSAIMFMPSPHSFGITHTHFIFHPFKRYLAGRPINL